MTTHWRRRMMGIGRLRAENSHFSFHTGAGRLCHRMPPPHSQSDTFWSNHAPIYFICYHRHGLPATSGDLAADAIRERGRHYFRSPACFAILRRFIIFRHYIRFFKIEQRAFLPIRMNFADSQVISGNVENAAITASRNRDIKMLLYGLRFPEKRRDTPRLPSLSLITIEWWSWVGPVIIREYFYFLAYIRRRLISTLLSMLSAYARLSHTHRRPIANSSHHIICALSFNLFYRDWWWISYFRLRWYRRWLLSLL